MRSFLVSHAEGVVVIDAGPPGNLELIAAGLARLGASWGDVTDVVLTHKHFDHAGGLVELLALAKKAAVWSGTEDAAEIAFEGTVRPIEEGDRVRDLRAVATPGHTPGHRSFIRDDTGLLFAGDALGTMDGVLTRGPSQFTEDAAGAERSLRRLASIDWERLVFSHGAEVGDPRGELRRLLAETDATQRTRDVSR